MDNATTYGLSLLSKSQAFSPSHFALILALSAFLFPLSTREAHAAPASRFVIGDFQLVICDCDNHKSEIPNHQSQMILSLIAAAPDTVDAGGALAYPGSGDTIYASVSETSMATSFA